MALTSNLALEKGAVRGKHGVQSDANMESLDKRLAGVNVVPFAATPVFDAALGAVQKITLTGNVTSSTITNPRLGQRLTFLIVQDGTGSRTFAWPANVIGESAIAAGPNTVSRQSFTWDGSNWYSEAVGTSA